MLEQTDKLERFAEVINKTALKQCKSAEKQAADFRTKELKRIKEELREETERKKSFALAGLSRNTNREIAAYENEMKQALSKKRDEITDRVFAQAKEQLEGYVLTDGYSRLLGDIIRSLTERVDVVDTLYVTGRDREAAERQLSLLGIEAGVALLPDDAIGGAAVLDGTGGVYVSDTLLERLEDERKRFMSYSGLTISL